MEWESNLLINIFLSTGITVSFRKEGKQTIPQEVRITDFQKPFFFFNSL